MCTQLLHTGMKRTSVRQFRANLADLIDQDEPIIVTRHGRAAAVLYPLRNVRAVPTEVRRNVVESIAREFEVDPDDEIVERFKRDVDRTLIRENLLRPAEERLRALQAMQELHDELRDAAQRAG